MVSFLIQTSSDYTPALMRDREFNTRLRHFHTVATTSTIINLFNTNVLGESLFGRLLRLGVRVSLHK